MFKVGDVVRFATGKVEYEVNSIEGSMVSVTKVAVVGDGQRAVNKTANADRIRLVRSVNSGRDSDVAREQSLQEDEHRGEVEDLGRDTRDEFDGETEISSRYNRRATRSVAFGHLIKQPSPEKPQETIGAVIRDEVPAHVPGESPAAYKARTGIKLDGRRTSYGRAILVALQPKLAPIGVKTRKARGRKADRG